MSTEGIKLDKAKIRTNISYFKGETVTFDKKYKGNKLIRASYTSEGDRNVPFNLYIGVNYTKPSLSIEFSSKVLGKNYPELISKETFKQCLENINALGICELDVEGIVADCHFTKVHVVKDVILKLTPTILNALNAIVRDYKRFGWEHYKTGITFSKDVKSKDCKESIVVYDKEVEIGLSQNKKFLSKLCEQDREGIIQHFQGVTRFEDRIETEEKIKKALNIPSTHISHVFSSTANPVLDLFNRIFGFAEPKQPAREHKPYDYFIMQTIEKHNHNLKMIEQDLRQYYKARSGLYDMMNRVRELCLEMLNANDSTVLTDIRKLLV